LLGDNSNIRNWERRGRVLYFEGGVRQFKTLSKLKKSNSEVVRPKGVALYKRYWSAYTDQQQPKAHEVKK